MLSAFSLISRIGWPVLAGALPGAILAADLQIEHVTIVSPERGTPSAPTYANPPGLNGWLEMRRLIEAGETPAQIFKSATLTNAQALRLDRDIGTVQVGKRANLLLLRQDPTQTIDAYAGIVKVILNGRVLDSSELTANARH